MKGEDVEKEGDKIGLTLFWITELTRDKGDGDIDRGEDKFLIR
ncbi:MAG: hypothetical protein R3Y29_02895 [bacterium]